MEDSPPSPLGAKSRGKFKRDALQELFPATNNPPKDSPTKGTSTTSERKALEYETEVLFLSRDDPTKPTCKCGEVLTKNFWCVQCSAFCVNKGPGSAKSPKGNSKGEEKK